MIDKKMTEESIGIFKCRIFKEMILTNVLDDVGRQQILAIETLIPQTTHPCQYLINWTVWIENQNWLKAYWDVENFKMSFMVCKRYQYIFLALSCCVVVPVTLNIT